MCSVLFYFCSQCVILGEVKPLTMHRREAADLFPTPQSHMAQHGCAVPGTGATPYMRGETLSSSTRGQDPLKGGSVVPGGHAGCLRIEPHVKPHTQISGHFLLWDSQLRGLVTHDELSNVETATAILALWTLS